MQYMLLLRETPEVFARRDDPAQATEYWGAWNTYIGAMAQAGIVVSGEGLRDPLTATTVRVRDGTREVQDGPYADAKEQLGGFFVVDVPDLDAAIAWAAKAPSAHYASVEIRPLMPPMARSAG